MNSTITNCLDCNTQILKTRNKKYCADCRHKRDLAIHRKNYQDNKDARLNYQERYSKDRGISGCIDRDRRVGYRFIKRELKKILYNDEFYENEVYGRVGDEEPYVSIYLGSSFSLDPCGKYHHMLSPNGVTKTCIKFWENLSQAAEDLSGWIENGEGDATDVYFCFMKSTYDEKIKNHNRGKKRRKK